MRLGFTAAVALLSLASVGSIPAGAQSAAVQSGAAANREYAAVFAHSDNPCSAANYATFPYVQCMSKELKFIESHLDAFVNDIREMADSPEELTSFNEADAAWRAYREKFCSMPYARFPKGTIKGPMSLECTLQVDRAYMEQLNGMYILTQFK